MKNNDITKRYRTRFIFNIIIAAFAVCLFEGLLILNMGRLIGVIMGIGEAEALEAAHSTEAIFFYIISAVMAFALIFYLLQRESLDYINRISEGISAVERGDLDSRIEVIGDDEFSSMAESINHMSEELKELLRSEREAEQSKNDLITNIAHDLKTPLTSIIGYLELLCDGKVQLSPEMEKKYLRIAYNKSRRLEQLIADLFSFTKLSYGRITMKVGYVDIVKLLSQLLEESYPSFAEAGISYELRSNVDSLEIAADGNLIARVFENLIGNAIKYGAEGKRVIVRI